MGSSLAGAGESKVWLMAVYHIFRHHDKRLLICCGYEWCLLSCCLTSSHLPPHQLSDLQEFPSVNSLTWCVWMQLTGQTEVCFLPTTRIQNHVKWAEGWKTKCFVCLLGSVWCSFNQSHSFSIAVAIKYVLLLSQTPSNIQLPKWSSVFYVSRD